MAVIDIFRCDNCRGVFIKAWPEHHAAIEFENTFPGEDLANAVILCSQCYVALLDFYRAQGRIPWKRG